MASSVGVSFSWRCAWRCEASR